MQLWSATMALSTCRVSESESLGRQALYFQGEWGSTARSTVLERRCNALWPLYQSKVAGRVTTLHKLYYTRRSVQIAQS
jgi:hypothetical protein